MHNQNILATKEEYFLEETLTQTITTIEETPPSHDVTLPQLEEEIKVHLNQIKQNIIEIGKRLIIAKSLVKHGEWIYWLENNFKLSYRTAKNFMDCAERFPNVKSIADLNSTQMIQLLSLPSAEDTEKFIKQKESAGTPVSDMSVKTLRKEIKQWKSTNTEITPVNSSKETLQVKEDKIFQPVVNQTNTELPDIDLQQSNPIIEPSNEENPNENNSLEEEPSFLQAPTEIAGTYLIEELFNTSTNLINHENRHKIIKIVAKIKPSQFATIIQNLNEIISEMQNALKSND